MTLLTICQNVVDEVGFNKINIIAGNNSKDARQLLQFANREGDSLSRAKRWNALTSEHLFVLVDGIQSYDLPSDFRFIVPSTTWDRDNNRMVATPLNSKEWQYFKGWASIGGMNRRARIRNNKIEFEQAITAADAGNTIAFEYISKYWAQTDGGVAKAKFTLDNDIPRLDEELITLGIKWRFKKEKGLDWEEDFAEYKLLKMEAMARDGGARTLQFCEPDDLIQFGVNIPDINYG